MYQDNVLSLDDMDDHETASWIWINLVNEPVKNISEIGVQKYCIISYVGSYFHYYERLKDFVNPNQPLALEWVFDLIDRRRWRRHNQNLKRLCRLSLNNS